jgi:putative transcriptional regulator
MKDHESATFFERLKKGMEDSIAYSRGELTLKTTTLPLPPPAAGRAEVTALRKRLKMSQSVFAAALNVSTKLVQSWEQGTRKPDRGDLRLIQILTKQPEIMTRLILEGAGRRSISKSAPKRRRASAA